MQIYSISSGPHITRFFGGCCYETEKFRVNLCFETSEHSVQTADDKSKVISQALELNLALCIFMIYFQIGIIL